MWRLAWRIVRHRDDAEDVVQETFLTAFRSLPEFRSAAAASKAMGLAKFFGSQVVALSVSPSGPETSLDLVEAELPVDLVAEEAEKEAEGFVRAAKEIEARVRASR